MSEEKGIWIIRETDDSKAISDWGADYDDSSDNNRNGFISASQLKRNVGEFLEVIKDAFTQAENASEGIQLSELECSIEISGKGQIGILGTGGEAGAKGAIKLKFTRKNG
ncbi:hypothetical protein [Crocosphaera sp. XPORK-15E]|uniref:Pepco domain-containing protein n=1 Tax=Crocosphaera sp. XPORK-15E TaxID=3110247 RepID=UPI002B1F3927|nr:hypothetical protein [Crocosphaera sp. XPORK-15E]MEA5535000.1 hypothetical protein [Crocosphaera sp. XPORK-15E]